MRTYKVVTTEQALPEQVTCNRCGKQGEYDICDIHTLEFAAGYGSLLDMACFQFELCDRCVSALVLSFKRPPVMTFGRLSSPDDSETDNEILEQVKQLTGNLKVHWEE